MNFKSKNYQFKKGKMDFLKSKVYCNHTSNFAPWLKVQISHCFTSKGIKVSFEPVYLYQTKNISVFPPSLKLHNRYYQRFQFRVVLFLQLGKYAHDGQNVFSLGFHQGYSNVIYSCNEKIEQLILEKLVKLLNPIYTHNDLTEKKLHTRHQLCLKMF